MGVRGKVWRVIKQMYEFSRSAVFLEGEKSDTFSLEQGVAQGCSLSPFIYGYEVGASFALVPHGGCLAGPIVNTSVHYT